jgi:thiamine biosynthesis lipoprotein
MPILETLPVGTDTAQWPVWGTTARLVVTDPATLPAARDLVERELAAVDAACSRFRTDSELSRLTTADEPGRTSETGRTDEAGRTGGAGAAGGGRGVEVSGLLAELVAAALAAAARTDGDVDPTVGTALRRLGYDRDVALLPARQDRPLRVVSRPVPGWRRVRLDGRRLTVPAGTVLDLGATAKALTADRCAALVAAACGTGVLVALGGDIATAGPAPDGGWRILVQDRPGDPSCTVAVPAGSAVATSSTTSRTWRRAGLTLHHVLDPRTGLPAEPVWRTVTVAAPSCTAANTLSTAALVRGRRAVAWLGSQRRPARLVTAGGEVLTLNGWPTEPAPGEERTVRS